MTLSNDAPDSLKEKIRQSIISEGFDVCRFTDASELSSWQQNVFQHWLQKKYHGTMRYMERNIEKRLNPSFLLEGVKSIIVVAINYFSEQNLSSRFRIAKYAYCDDYHYVIKQRLARSIKKIPELANDDALRIFTDSAPVAERFLAVRSGIGFIGKNNTLIIPQKGSFFFLAEIFTKTVLHPDPSFPKSMCGNCTRCLDACPTQALVQPYLLDAKKCLSYLTIEEKSDISIPISKNARQNWIFGCDVCMEVCPHNRFATANKTLEFQPNKAILTMTEEAWKTLDKTTFNRYFKNAPLQRAGYNKIMNNIDFCLK
jgi:epoxyqueuosine reductase